jgi:hypothetical protein
MSKSLKTEYVMRLFSLVIFSVLLSTSTNAQTIKLNDFRSDFSKNHIKSRTCYQVTYQNFQPVDSIIMNESLFDESGRIIQYTHFFARGKKLYTINYNYDEKGQLARCILNHAFSDVNPVDLIIEKDEKGKVLSLVCPSEIRNFWTKEEFAYNEKGRMVASAQFSKQNGEWVPREKQEYSPTIHSGENTPTFIHDSRGLLILHQLAKSDSVAPNKAFCFNYTTY